MEQAWAGRQIVVLNWRDLEHPQAGGAEVFAERISEQFAQRGANVTLLASRIDGRPNITTRNGYIIRRGGGTFGVYPAALRWLLSHRRDVDAVIDCQNGIPFFSPLVLARRTPVIQVIHHVHQRQFALFFGRIAATVGRQLEARGARLVYRQRPSASVSPSTRDEVRTLLKLPGARFIVPNGVEFPAVPDIGARSPEPSIVCVGRLVPHKRVELLLHAVAGLADEVPGLQVHLVGDGPDEARLHELAAQLRLPQGLVTWHGRLPERERDALLATAWLTVNTTHGEGWGISVMEAATLAVPAMAFDVPGMRDSIRHGTTGWLVAEDAPLAPAIAFALRELAEPRVARRYRAACRAWAARFSWQRSGDLLERLLTAEAERLTGGRHQRRAPDGDDVVVDLSPCDGLGTQPAFRVTDLYYTDCAAPRVLLYGSGVAGAEQALARVLGEGAAPCRGLRIRPAEASDYLKAATG